MCGIAGIYNLTNNRQLTTDNRNIIKEMTNSLKHRGPDDEGFFVDKKIALGHRRLSIIDLSKAGHQPMTFDNGNLLIVFNGEIYNYIEIREELLKKGYKFKSKTDTEVILAAYRQWGEKCLEKFNGMWAFVIYDKKKDTLFASRDRFGVKPFYYFLDNEKFIFASEIKAILKYPDIKIEPNDDIIWDYLAGGLVDHTDETFFKGIKELRGGQYLKIRNPNVEIRNYWKLSTKELSISDEEAAEEFKKLFIDSVKLRLRSDVPVGTCLSGGLDSSAIVGVVNEFLKKDGKIKQIGKWQKTFSAVYKNKEYKSFDEKYYIDKVIKKTKADASFTYPMPSDFTKDLEKIIYHHDAPFLTVSVFAQWSVFKLAHSKKMKVMLDGQGSDELLAGYLTFFPVMLKSLRREGKYGEFLRELHFFIKLHWRQAFKKSIYNFFKFPLFKSIARGRVPKLKEIYQGSYLDFSLFSLEYQKHKAFKQKKAKNIREHSQNLLSGKGLPALLRYEDRNSMAFSIESRTPFLDYRLVSFIYNLSDDKKINRGQTKAVMRKALRGTLPEEIRTRQDKIGFEAPEEIWFRKELASQIRKTFQSESFAKRKYFQAQKVLRAFDRYINGDPVSYQLFWRIYNLELWLRRYFD